jgi:2-dehydro-3-deoxygluconokinase
MALGETMVMIAPARPESLKTADDLRLHVGGAESNVATHLAALGIRSAWVSAVGDDVLGERVLAEVARRGADVRWVSVDPLAPTGVYFKDPGRGVLYYRRGSAASRLTPESVAAVPLERAEVVHVSGITPALSAGCAALIDAVVGRVAASDALLSFDVNHRGALWAPASDPAAWHPGDAATVLRALAGRSDVVFVGLDEAQGLWGCDSAADVRRLLPEPERLVVKDGDVGATEFHRAAREDAAAVFPDTVISPDTVTFVPAIRTEVVEPVGAGDAFAAGYLAALLNGEDAMGRLRAGHARASLVLRSTSDFVIEN